MLSLGEAGYREVTLLGQNIDAYGRSAERWGEEELVSRCAVLHCFRLHI
jgi:tRNA A37 methylthiotransferase MiaB